ncbi:M23 family peptidase [Neobacillus piezotolerans]|uniref:M23 family peptidase n=1 Tax=Neobacillus piezotolerans TaxID=2259171 RepID=A0A3D8GUR2_9BACI|nr:M23 family metallopeptidase [Neobacillus piezotolerans]RDU37959.1 M23 family peptidase [Neobacillus piezotolerans]
MREEEKKQSSRGFKRFLKKSWVVPAVYIASAAIILTGVLWYQMSGDSAEKYNYKTTENAKKKFNEPALEVNKSLENFAMPVVNKENAVIQKKFYENSADPKEQQEALVVYNNTYVPNTGLNIAMKDGSDFDVVASLSGTVTRVEEDSLLGNVIEIQHDKGIVTQYQSVKDIKVKAGDQVEKGQVLAGAGQSQVNQKGGTHVHFEIRKDGVAVNPANYFDKPLSSLQNSKTDEPSKKKESVEGEDKGNTPVDEEDADSAEDGLHEPSGDSTDKSGDKKSS